MKKQICTEPLIVPQIQKFLNSEKIDLEIVTGSPGDIEITISNVHKESTITTIYSGGWITCETARSLAKKINISLNQMGKLLNNLDVKIRRCSLGCFK